MTSARPTMPAHPLHSSGTILVIEDDLTICALLLDLLTDLGHPAMCVHDGQRGIDAIREFLPALVLLDYNLPVLDGTAVLSALAGSAAKLPVVLMTSDPRGKALAQAHSVGFLAKPFELDQAIDMISASTIPATGA